MSQANPPIDRSQEVEPVASPPQPFVGHLVRSIFSRFESAGICWAILRRVEGLPDYTRYDIDLLVSPSDLTQAGNLIQKASTEQGWRTIATIDKYHYRCYLLMSRDPQPRYLPIDLFPACSHRYHLFADARLGLERRLRVGEGMWAVPPGFGAAVAVVKELARFDRFKENSRDEVREGATLDPENFQGAIEPYLGCELSAQIRSVCQQGDWSALEALAPDLRHALMKPRLSKVFPWMAFMTKSVFHHLRPPMNLFVVLLGPDGSGKTTIAQTLCQRLWQHPFKVCRSFEFNFRILPELKQFKVLLGKLLGRSIHLEEPPPPGTRHAGMNAPLSTPQAMLYITYYAIDWCLGYALLRRIRGQCGLIVFARYYYDYYYMTGYRNAPDWFLKLIEFWIPKPDLLIYLERDAETIYNAKPELEIDEIRRQQEVIQRLLQNRPNGREIDARHGIDETNHRVSHAILEVLLSPSGDRKK